MMSRREIHVKIKNIDTGNAMFIAACVLFALFVFCFTKGETIEKTNVVATIIIALVALRFQAVAYRKEKTEKREKDILRHCGMIKNELIHKEPSDKNGDVIFSREGECGIRMSNDGKHNFNVEIDFSYILLTKDCSLYILVKNLKGDNVNEYEEPYKCVRFISSPVTNGVIIYDIRESFKDERKEEKECKPKELSIEKIGNYEWNEIRGTLIKLLDLYANKKRDSAKE